MGVDHAYQLAVDAYVHDQLDRTVQLATDLVEGDPGHPAWALLALCHRDQGDRGQAERCIRALHALGPGRYDTAFAEVGRLLQEREAYRAAAKAFRSMTKVGQREPNIKLRLSECEARSGDESRASESAGRPATAPELSAWSLGNRRRSGRSVRHPVEGVARRGRAPAWELARSPFGADRGDLVETFRQRVRHLLPGLLSVLLAAVGITLIKVVVPAILAQIPAATRHQLPHVPPSLSEAWHGFSTLVLLLAWLTVGLLFLGIFVRAWRYQVYVFEHGVEVDRGVFHRTVEFLWYYQLPSEPRYVRTTSMFWTRTATLVVKYNDSQWTTKDLTLDGIGRPRQVRRLQQFIESRRLTERGASGGGLT